MGVALRIPGKGGFWFRNFFTSFLLGTKGLYGFVPCEDSVPGYFEIAGVEGVEMEGKGAIGDYEWGCGGHVISFSLRLGEGVWRLC